ncbi:hypothetical protein MFIFM68171_05938 [Madurella fahalii]|uniref:Uncharacterized protein n=1 Tax=Madurella fahalii TaxID=1157608 RepID=A0ABQ0GDB4_9PEZI
MLQKVLRHAQDDAEPPNICVRSISVYGQAGMLAQSLEYPIAPLSHDPGGVHIVSAQFVSRLSGHELQTTRDWAHTGSCHIRIVWGYPGHEYPSFTTRHLLTDGGIPGEVSFSGGLDWALRIMENAKAFKLMRRPAGGPEYPIIPSSTSAGDVRKWPLRGPARTWPVSRSRPEPSSPSQVPEIPRPMSPELADDQISICSELTSATTISDTDTDISGSHSPNSAEPREPFPGIGSAATHLADNLFQQAVQNDEFHRRRRAAEALYAHNGDTSGLLAVQASVSRFRGS